MTHPDVHVLPISPENSGGHSTRAGRSPSDRGLSYFKEEGVG
jgi:hypothetical protein